MRGSRLISAVRLKRRLEKSIIVCFSHLCSISCGKGKQSDRCWCWGGGEGDGEGVREVLS